MNAGNEKKTWSCNQTKKHGLAIRKIRTFKNFMRARLNERRMQRLYRNFPNKSPKNSSY